MGGVTEIAASMLSRAFERTETAAQNLTNMTTPGYKAQRSFAGLLIDSSQRANTKPAFDFSAGALQNTGDPLNLAISGTGFFTVSSGAETYYTRDGQFTRDADGRLVTAGGFALQADNGGDVVVSQNNPQILEDGTVVENGQPVSHIGLTNFADLSALSAHGAGLYAAAQPADALATGRIRQGMIETSNVSTADEMVSIMASTRTAESGSKLIQVYDDLMGRALDAFGQT
jgi:flagellar basal body rod protein FlgG